MRLDKGAQTPKSFANCKEILISHNKTCVKYQSVSKQKNENFVIDHWMYYDCLREILPDKCVRCLLVTHMFQAMSSWEAVREGSSTTGLKYIL